MLCLREEIFWRQCAVQCVLQASDRKQGRSFGRIPGRVNCRGGRRYQVGSVELRVSVVQADSGPKGVLDGQGVLVVATGRQRRLRARAAAHGFNLLRGRRRPALGHDLRQLHQAAAVLLEGRRARPHPLRHSRGPGLI